MQIRFADRRPDGDYALVLPVAGNDLRVLNALADRPTVEAALQRQRFEGEAASVAEQFISDNGQVRRLLLVGTGTGPTTAENAEKLGSAVAARLQTSGETHAVVDLTGVGADAEAAARVALGAALRSWRYDRYRTKLKDKQKPTLTELTIVGAGQGRRAALGRALAGRGRGHPPDPRAGDGAR
jgi:leucyl aminopeptidase